ncbi:MAG: DUF1822 family protein [Cyanobacteriota bacterium]|nr:DUF1822 family protein [Cyanobacteriota bacterium]
MIDSRAALVEAIDWYNEQFPNKITGPWVAQAAKQQGWGLNQPKYSGFYNGSSDLSLPNFNRLLSVLPEEAFFRYITNLSAQRPGEDAIDLSLWKSNTLPDWVSVKRAFINSGSRGRTTPMKAREVESLIGLARSGLESNSIPICRQGATLLGEVPKLNDKVLEILLELLELEDETTRWQAAFSLGKLQPKHSKAGLKRAKVISLGEQKWVLTVGAIWDERSWVFVDFAHRDLARKLPAKLMLKIFDARAKEQLYQETQGGEPSLSVRFSPPPNTQFSVQVIWEEFSHLERFKIGNPVMDDE